MLFDCLFTTFDGNGWIRSGEFCDITDRFCPDGFIGPKLLLFRLFSTPAKGSVAESSLLICIPILLFELFPLFDAFKSSLLSTAKGFKRKVVNFHRLYQVINLHSSSVILLSLAESFSSGNGLPDELLFLLSFVSLLLLLSLLFTLLEVEGPEPDGVDNDGVGSFFIIVVGGEPSSCFIDVTTSCSDEPKMTNLTITKVSFISNCVSYSAQLFPPLCLIHFYSCLNSPSCCCFCSKLLKKLKLSFHLMHYYYYYLHCYCCFLYYY
jgi:hypothetical protein